MLKWIAGAFVVLHGLVHLLYFGQSRRLFEMRPGMVWPDGSWAFSRLLGDEATRALASVLCIVAAASFAVGGAAILFEQGWWRQAIAGAAIFSSAVYILFWDGTPRQLDAQGWIGILINIAILVAVFLLRWPGFDF